MSHNARRLHPLFRLAAAAIALVAVVDELWDLLAGSSGHLALHIGRVTIVILFGYVAATGTQIVLPLRGEDL